MLNKHKIVAIISVAVILAVAICGSVAYEHHRNWEDVQNAKAKAAAWIKAQEVKQEQAKQAAQVNALKTQCAKDHQLFVDTKGKSAAGDCNVNLQIVQ